MDECDWEGEVKKRFDSFAMVEDEGQGNAGLERIVRSRRER